MSRSRKIASPLTVPGRIRGVTLLQYPSGRWGFAGRVPMDLSYRNKDGSPITEELADSIRSFGPGLFKNKVDSVSFDTAEDAIEAARALGVEPDNASKYE
jgi:hypothetical protein